VIDTREMHTQLAADPWRSRRLHAAAYRWLAGAAPRAGDPAQLARHALAACPDVADDEVAACLAAARSEREAYRLDTAIEFATRGLALTADSRGALRAAHRAGGGPRSLAQPWARSANRL
jgi:hypothetical protein